MIANKECYERGCACYDSRVDDGGIEVVAKHEWVGLTDEEIKRIGKLDLDSNYFGLWYDFAKAIEAKLKEKNSDHRN